MPSFDAELERIDAAIAWITRDLLAVALGMAPLLPGTDQWDRAELARLRAERDLLLAENNIA